MKFKTDKLSLLNVLQNLIAIVPSKTTLQVLTNFLFSLRGDELSACATDLDISMKTILKVKGELDGEVTVNARKFFEIARELPDGGLTIEVAKSVLQLSSDRGFSCKIAGADTADFPQPPVIDSAVVFSMPSHVIRNLSEKTAFAVSQDNTRQSLNGICWDIRDKEMIMVATDGHRLGFCNYKHNINAKGGKSIILSPKAMTLLCRILSEKEIHEVGVSLGNSYISFTADASTITSKLLQGPYPNYEMVIPKNNTKSAKIDKNALTAAIRRVAVLSSVKTHQVKFSFGQNNLELSVVNRDFGGEAKETVPVTYSSDPLDIGFNAGFFMEILKLTDTSRVQLTMNSAVSACLFYPDKEEKAEAEYFFLLMPLRLMTD